MIRRISIGLLFGLWGGLQVMAAGEVQQNQFPQLVVYATDAFHAGSKSAPEQVQAMDALVAAGRWSSLASIFKQNEGLIAQYPSAAIALAENMTESDVEYSQQLTTILLASETSLNAALQARLNQLVIGRLMRDGQSDEALREILRVQKRGVTLSESLVSEVALSQLYTGQNMAELAQLKPLSAPFQLVSRAIEWKNSAFDNAQLSAVLIKQLNDKAWQPSASLAKLPVWIADQLGNDSLSFHATLWTLSANTVLSSEQKDALLVEWQRLGERAANRHQLLAGDDASWLAAIDSVTNEQSWESVVLSARLILDAQSDSVKVDAAKKLMQRLNAAPLVQWRLLPVLKVDSLSAWLASLDPTARWALLAHLDETEANSAEIYRVWLTVVNDLPAESRKRFAKAAIAAGAGVELRQSILQWLDEDNRKQVASHGWLTALMSELQQKDAPQAHRVWAEIAPLLSVNATSKDWQGLAELAAQFQDWPSVMRFGSQAWQSGVLEAQVRVRPLLILGLRQLGYPEEAKQIENALLTKAIPVALPAKPSKGGKK